MALSSDMLKEFALGWGADVCRIADLARLTGIHTEPGDLLVPYRRAISIAVRLADGVIDPIIDRPTPLYQQHYMKVNALLDDIALAISGLIQINNGKGLPLPASQVLDKTNLTSYLSHKAVAVAAGVGWQGKSLLTVSKIFGPRIRLVTVLTDLALAVDEPVKNRCGSCTKCTDACPAQAIKNVNTETHYGSRDEALHFEKCRSKVMDEHPKLEHIDSPICGVCIRACPWGQPKP